MFLDFAAASYVSIFDVGFIFFPPSILSFCSDVCWMIDFTVSEHLASRISYYHIFSCVTTLFRSSAVIFHTITDTENVRCRLFIIYISCSFLVLTNLLSIVPTSRHDRQLALSSCRVLIVTNGLP